MIAWVDVETTGLEPRRGFLLEVGVILTDDELSEQGRYVVALELPPAHKLNLRPEVYSMHESSGLLDECEAFGFPREEAMFKLIRWLNERVEEPPVMAGNTVGFDRAWLKAKMPVLEALFHYRSIDVSSLKELNRRWEFAEPWIGDRKLHRALPDLEDSIAELRHYRKVLIPGERSPR